MATPEVLEFHGLEISVDKIAEHQDGRRTVVIKRSAIRAIRLEHGFIAERPLRQVLFGLVLILLGVFLGRGFWWRVLTSSPAPQASRFMFVAPPFLVALGALMFRDVIRRGWFLRVETESDARKLRITGNVDRVELMAFIGRVRDELGYDVRGAEPP
jgi:hypothetical protein